MPGTKKRILSVLGTRPEAIKLAPVIHELRRRDMFEALLCTTGQHRQMLAPMLRLFDLVPDVRLGLMRPGQSLNSLMARLVGRLDEVLEQLQPDAVLVQGDTTTAFAAAMAAFHRQIPVGHVEAGLRTLDATQPFPEEINRQLISRLARWHFAPTTNNAEQLRREGVPAAQVFVTGNPVIDALKQVLNERIPAKSRRIKRRLVRLGYRPDDTRRLILVTGHRRENHGPGMENFCLALKRITELLQDVDILFPVHLNPRVLTPVQERLGDCAGIHLMPPLDYETFVWLMARCWILISDSGGVQEEAPALDRPVLVTRNCTERQEGLEAGTSILVGTDPDRIVKEVLRLADDPDHYRKMASAENPYGRGDAARRIVDVLQTESA